MIVKTPSAPDEIRQSARHVLFVEGSGQYAIDKTAVENLLEEKIRVEPLGASYQIRSAAEALHKHHPDYYFLIDRDHYDDRYVEQCWNNFPDPAISNLLIWRRREIENYFLIPEYITKSQWLSVSADKIYAHIIQHCKERIYLDAANQVIISVREKLKKNWITLFTKPQEINNKESAIKKLAEAGEFLSYEKLVSKTVQNQELIERFEKILADMTGGKEPVEYGCGKWIEMIRGKEILPGLVDSCFTAKDRSDNPLQGPQELKEVVRDLVKKPLSEQPADFQQLHRLISDRIKS
jgi:hypothetical protein